MIWASGYQNGDFHGHIYEDAVRKLRAWKAEGLFLYVYSSGSVPAQKLLFAHTEYGDLTPLFSGYFDTRVGPKQESASYTAIAHQIGLPGGNILFLSDIDAELDAARQAGLQTVRLLREGCILSKDPHLTARNFDEIAV
jgi:enolase-phosphatase E1